MSETRLETVGDGRASPKMVAAQVSSGGVLRDVLEALDRGALGIALMVSHDGTLDGIMTDGDVRRALLAGAGISDPMGSHLRRDYLSVDASVPRDTVLELMQARRIQQIPVVDDRRRLLGLHTLHAMLKRDPLPNWALVMAGGRGERLRPLTDSVPKPMVRVAGRPILERLVLNLAGLGFQKVFISVNYLRDQIENFFADGRNHGCSVEYLREDTPLGTGGALSLLPRPPDVPIVVLNGDVLTQCDVGRMLQFHDAGRYRATIAYQEYFHRVPFGVLDLNGDEVRGMREKPSKSWPTNAGIYVLDPDVVARVPPNTNVTLPSVLEDCLERGERVGAYRITDDWIDVGRPSDLSRARGEDDVR